MSNTYEKVEVTSAAQLRSWLAAHHGTSPGVWLVTHKKAAGGTYVPYEEIVRELLSYGWIDSLARGVDQLRSSILITPRRPTSTWSRPNKERIAQLEASGLMAEPGRRVVEAAKASGTWAALEEVENLVEPAELRAALDAAAQARANWDAFPRSTRRAALEWIAAAKRPATRAHRIAEIVALATDNRRPQQWPRP